MNTSDFTTKDIERFYAKIDYSDSHPLGCHVWKSTQDSNGYGRIKINDRMRSAHRMSWELAYGKIPNGMQILHDCDNPNCCDPNHLHLGTPADNARDREDRNRGNHSSARGEHSGQAKLTLKQVKEIRGRYAHHSRANGGSALAKEFGVSQQQISRIVNDKRWKE